MPYSRFRNGATSGGAVADAIKIGYRPLAEVNEYFYELDDGKLKDLIIQVTGADSDSQTVNRTLSTLKTLKAFADFEVPKTLVTEKDDKPLPVISGLPHLVPTTPPKERLGLNLSYTINLNLPATSDQAVFNAIFRSLKEHLLSDEE